MIDSLITTESNYLLHCVLVKQGDPTPSSLFLLSSLTQSPPWFVSSDRPHPLTLSAASVGSEMALIRGVSCLVATCETGYFSPIFLATPLDLRDESPAVSVVVAAVTATSVRFTVTPSIACQLWCDVFPEEFPPTVGELQRQSPLFVRDETSVQKNGLIPGSRYAVFCYAESPRGSPMARSVVDSRGSFITCCRHASTVSSTINSSRFPSNIASVKNSAPAEFPSNAARSSNASVTAGDQVSSVASGSRKSVSSHAEGTIPAGPVSWGVGPRG